MIRAEHQKWAELIFNAYINHLLHKNFHSFYVVGELPDLNKYNGLIITPNHFSWWDGFITSFLIRKLTNKKNFIMMLEDQLKRYRFFKKVGAFSINPSNPVSMVKTMDYTRNILMNKENIVVLYPQGEIQPLTADDIIIKQGLQLIVRKNMGGKFALPLALKIEYGKNKKPDIAAAFGRIFTADEINNDYDAFSEEFTLNINRLRKFSDFEGCRNLF